MYKIKMNKKEYEIISSQENVFSITKELKEDAISVYLNTSDSEVKNEIKELVGTNIKAEIVQDTVKDGKKVIATIDESYKLQELSRNLLSANGFTIRFIKSA